MVQQEQEPQSQRKGPPPGWRYPVQAKHRSRLRGWLAKVWRGVKNNAALVSLVGVLLTLLVTTVLAQQEQIRNAAEAQKLADQQAQAARLQTERQAQYSALQSYIDEMSLLIDERNLQVSKEGDTVFTLAQARTTTTMAQLDGEQNQIVALFLSGSGLLREPALLAKTGLPDARLHNAVLPEANLAGTNLNRANLTDAVLINADFYATEKVGKSTQVITADLPKADLSRASLQGANLSGCLLKETTLTDAALQSAVLRGASLQGADLSHAALQRADLSPATVPGFPLAKMPTNLTDANLTDAKGWTREQLTAARSLEGATMPDGQTLKSDRTPDGPTFEEWLKSKGSG